MKYCFQSVFVRFFIFHIYVNTNNIFSKILTPLSLRKERRRISSDPLAVTILNQNISILVGVVSSRKAPPPSLVWLLGVHILCPMVEIPSYYLISIFITDLFFSDVEGYMDRSFPKASHDKDYYCKASITLYNIHLLIIIIIINYYMCFWTINVVGNPGVCICVCVMACSICCASLTIKHSQNSFTIAEIEVKLLATLKGEQV